MVRDEIGPVAAFKLALTVPRLPKTRSGKILRGHHEAASPTTSPGRCRRRSTMPRALDEIGESLKGRGIGAV